MLPSSCLSCLMPHSPSAVPSPGSSALWPQHIPHRWSHHCPPAFRRDTCRSQQPETATATFCLWIWVETFRYAMAGWSSWCCEAFPVAHHHCHCTNSSSPTLSRALFPVPLQTPICTIYLNCKVSPSLLPLLSFVSSLSMAVTEMLFISTSLGAWCSLTVFIAKYSKHFRLVAKSSCPIFPFIPGWPHEPLAQKQNFNVKKYLW